MSFNNWVGFFWWVFTRTRALSNFAITFTLNGYWPKILTKRVCYFIVAGSNLWTRQRFESGWRLSKINHWLLRLRNWKCLFRIVVSRAWTVLNFLRTLFSNGDQLHLIERWRVAVGAGSKCYITRKSGLSRGRLTEICFRGSLENSLISSFYFVCTGSHWTLNWYISSNTYGECTSRVKNVGPVLVGAGPNVCIWNNILSTCLKLET